MVPRQQSGGSPRHLGAQVRTLVDRSSRDLEQLGPVVGRGVDLEHGEGHRSPDRAREPTHPVDLLVGLGQVLASRARRGKLEDPRAEFAQRGADAEEFVLGGEGSRDRFAVDRAVRDGAGGRKAQRAGHDGLAHDGPHLVDLLGVGRLVAGPALAHDVGTDRAVGDLGADVDRPMAALERVEVFRERLPVPGDAFAQSGARDVLDALHQTDQPLAPIGVHGRKAHAAVAHHERGHAVPRRGGEDLIPGGLAVVMGVDVDPAWGHQQAVGIDGPLGAGVAQRADFADATLVDCDVTATAGLTAPVHHGATANH